MRYQQHIIDEGIKDKLSHVMKALKIEGLDSTRMMQTFFDALKHKLKLKDNRTPSDSEMKAALHQLKDVGKLSMVAAFFLNPLPGAGGLFFVIEKLANKYDRSLLPDAFKEI